MMAMMAAMTSVMFTACSNDADEVSNNCQEQGSKTIKFSCYGDFTMTSESMTRSLLVADGKEMTDLWILDYLDGTLVQQIHQEKTDELFGWPIMTLNYGTHHIYFVASRGEGAVISTTDHKITWTKPLDTFYKDFSITVDAGTSTSQALELDRCVTRLKISVNDEIPAGIATITVTPTTWYYGIDYLTGDPTEAKTSTARVFNIPSSYVGTTGEVNTNMYGFSGATEWTTDVTVVAKDNGGSTIGSVSINDAPLVANRVTNYAGNLFNSNSGFAVNLNVSWGNDYEGTW